MNGRVVVAFFLTALMRCLMNYSPYFPLYFPPAAAAAAETDQSE